MMKLVRMVSALALFLGSIAPSAADNTTFTIQPPAVSPAPAQPQVQVSPPTQTIPQFQVSPEFQMPSKPLAPRMAPPAAKATDTIPQKTIAPLLDIPSPPQRAVPTPAPAAKADAPAEMPASPAKNLSPQITEPQQPKEGAHSVNLPEQRYANPVLVTKVQDLLAQMGYDVGVPDGMIGGQTRNAVKTFQLDHGMTPNGWITTYLLAEIERIMAQPPVSSDPSGSEVAPVIEAPVIVTWDLRSLLGKTTHAISGDRLGTITNVLVDADGSVRQLAVDVATLYGEENGNTALDWGVLNPAVNLPVIMTKLDSVQVNKLRTLPQPIQEQDGQWQAADLLGADAVLDDAVVGSVKNVIFDQSGKLLRYVVQAEGASCPMDVPAADATVQSHDKVLRLSKSQVENCTAKLPNRTLARSTL